MEPRRHHRQDQNKEINLKSEELSSRKLRSTAVKPKVNDAVLFNFDQVNEYLHRSKPISVINTTTANQSPYKYYGYNSSQLPNLPVRSPVVKIDRVLPRRPPKNDPLPDSTYEIFHRRMKRNEKQMSNEERIKNLWELDILQSHLEDLNQSHWFRALPAITSIKDIKDYEELERKRDLTIAEIERLLRKHEDWRKRLENFNNDVKSYIDYGDTESDPEYEIPIEKLRQHREWERRQKYGPIIKLNLNEKYCLIIDPLAAPKIIEIETQDTARRHLKSEKTMVINEPEDQEDEESDEYVDSDEYEKPVESYRRKRRRLSTEVKLEDLIDVSGIDFNTRGTKIFGTEFNDLPTFRNGYQLPTSLKNWLNRR